MIRTKFILVLAALALSACGSDDRAEPAMPAQTADTNTEQTVAEEVTAPESDDTTEADAQPQMVEESSAASADEDKTIVLARAENTADDREWKFESGKNYAQLVPTQPTVGGADKIEVAEIFWYGCNHCYDFEQFINRWKETKDADVRFVRIPATWNPLVRLHAQLYYTEEVLAKSGQLKDPETFRAAVFAEYHRRGNRMASLDAIQAIFEKHGVSEEDFMSTWESFEVAQKLRVADDLQRRYSITGVPAVVVNGKYRSGAAEVGGYPQLLELIDELVERERIR